MDRPDQHLWTSREVARILSLVEAERRYYQDILGALPVGVAVVNGQMEVISANRVFRRWFQRGQRDWKSIPLAILFPAPEIAACVSDTLSAQSVHQQVPVRVRSGDQYRQALLSCLPVRNWEGTTDEALLLLEEPQAKAVAVSPEMRLTEQLAAQRERVEAVGRLAARVSHSLNNVWMLICGYGEELLQTLPEGSQEAGDVKEILAGAERVGSLARQLQQCARRPVAAGEPVSLSQALEGIDPPPRFGLPADSTWVNATLEELRDLLRTLSQCAAGGGKVSISASRIIIPEHAAQVVASLPAGQYAAIRIATDGPAVFAETLSRLLDPLVGSSQGNEVNLYPAYFLARQWGGDLQLESSAATLYLPLLTEARFADSSAVEAPPRVERPAEPLPPAATTILVVEDEAGIRALMRKILHRQGYQVFEAESGPAALELAGKLEGELQLLVTDLMMPEMNGRELAERLTELRPNLQVLYVSGFTDDSSIYAEPLPKGTMFLQKPFTLAALLEKVRASLGQPCQP
jgi:CheY-like chemotaxis protein